MLHDAEYSQQWPRDECRPCLPGADRLLTEEAEADCDTMYSNSFLKYKRKFRCWIPPRLDKPEAQVVVPGQELAVLRPHGPGHRWLESLLRTLWQLTWWHHDYLATKYLVKRLQVPQRHVIPSRDAAGNVETIPHLATSVVIARIIGRIVNWIDDANVLAFVHFMFQCKMPFMIQKIVILITSCEQ